MSNTFLIADTHFGHTNILTFKKDDGTLIRPDFKSIAHHDEMLIYYWNSVVSPQDKVYHLGDVGLTNWTHLSRILSALNGTKILIKGNHDGAKLSQYAQHFKDVRGSHVLDKFILTHIPIHPDSLSRWKCNIHGHVHTNTYKDKRYYNVSVENINFRPISFDVIREEQRLL